MRRVVKSSIAISALILAVLGALCTSMLLRYAPGFFAIAAGSVRVSEHLVMGIIGDGQYTLFDVAQNRPIMPVYIADTEETIAWFDSQTILEGDLACGAVGGDTGLLYYFVIHSVAGKHPRIRTFDSEREMEALLTELSGSAMYEYEKRTPREWIWKYEARRD